MLQIAQMVYECLVAIEILAAENKGLSRDAMRRAIVQFLPLGMQTHEIDLLCSVICNTLNHTNLVTERDGVFYFKKPDAAPPADNVNLN